MKTAVLDTQGPKTYLLVFDPDEEVMAGLLAFVREKQISERRGELFQTEYLPKLRPFPGTKDLLARMKKAGLELAVASSSKKDELGGLLEVCGADEFVKASTSSDDAENSKPDPDIVHAALDRLGHPPQRSATTRTPAFRLASTS